MGAGDGMTDDGGRLVENVAGDSRWQIKREVAKPRIPRLGRQQGRQGRLG